MQLIRCTQKLLKELKPEISNNEPDAGILGGWHANFYRFDRRKCVLVTNDKTLYSVFMPCLKKPDFLKFPDVFRRRLSQTLSLDGFSKDHQRAVLEELKEIEFAKSNSRSVLGSINEYGIHIGPLIEYYGNLCLNFMSINKAINGIPMGALKYSNGLEAMSEVLKKYDG